MLCPPLSPSPMVADWLERHRHRASFALHIVGIPVSVIGLLLLPISVPTISPWVALLAVGLFVAGYGFQFLGHALEGTEPGEVTLLRKRLRRSSPRLGEVGMSAKPVAFSGTAGRERAI